MPGEQEATISSPDFDMSAALSDISNSLGFEGTDDDTSTTTDTDTSTVDTAAGDTDTTRTTGAPAPTAQAPATAAAPVAPTPPPGPEVVDINTPPKTWTKEGAAAWEQLPEHTRAEIHKREQDMFKGIEQYRDGANFGYQIASIFKPYDQLLQHFGVTPQQIIPGLVAAHATLTVGSEDAKLDTLTRLVNDYKIPLPKLLAKLTGGALTDTEPYVDPTVKDLQGQVQALQSKLETRERSELTARQADINTKVTAFFNDPANIYASELAEDIATLIRSGVTQDLKVAYEKAMWANPVTRLKEQQRVAAAAETERRDKAAKAAEAAKKANAVNVRATGKGHGPTANPDKSIDDTLRETLANIQKRG